MHTLVDRSNGSDLDCVLHSWSNLYTDDLLRPTSSEDDLPTWFSDCNAPAKIISYLKSLGLPPETSIIDLGTGNGALLFSLREEGFLGEMLGLDYAVEGVKLAEKLAEERAFGTSGGKSKRIDFMEWDILSSSPWQRGEWDLVIDKGTFDAISLSGGGKEVGHDYRTKTLEMVKKGGLFLITSCNWTEEELKSWFERVGQLEYEGRIEYKKFSFGGQSGQSVSSVCFRKVG